MIHSPDLDFSQACRRSLSVVVVVSVVVHLSVVHRVHITCFFGMLLLAIVVVVMVVVILGMFRARTQGQGMFPRGFESRQQRRLLITILTLIMVARNQVVGGHHHHHRTGKINKRKGVCLAQRRSMPPRHAHTRTRPRARRRR